MRKDIKNLQIKLCYPVEKIFSNMVNSITDIKIDEIKYPNNIFYFNNNEYICIYNKKFKYFWCDYEIFCQNFYLNGSFNYADNLLCDMMIRYFKLKNI